MFGYRHSTMKTLAHRGVADQGRKSYELLHNRLEKHSGLNAWEFKTLKSWDVRVGRQADKAIDAYEEKTAFVASEEFGELSEAEQDRQRVIRRDLKEAKEAAEAQTTRLRAVGEKTITFFRANLADEALIYLNDLDSHATPPPGARDFNCPLDRARGFITYVTDNWMGDPCTVQDELITMRNERATVATAEDLNRLMSDTDTSEAGIRLVYDLNRAAARAGTLGEPMTEPAYVRFLRQRICNRAEVFRHLREIIDRSPNTRTQMTVAIIRAEAQHLAREGVRNIAPRPITASRATVDLATETLREENAQLRLQLTQMQQLPLPPPQPLQTYQYHPGGDPEYSANAAYGSPFNHGIGYALPPPPVGPRPPQSYYGPSHRSEPRPNSMPCQFWNGVTCTWAGSSVCPRASLHVAGVDTRPYSYVLAAEAAEQANKRARGN